MHGFEKKRKYVNHKSGVQKEATEIFTYNICLNIYFNHSRYSAEKSTFEADLFELKPLLEVVESVDVLPDSTQTKVKKYFIIKKRGAK